MYDIDIPFTVKKLPARTVVGIARRTCNADGRSTRDIMATWENFLKTNASGKIKNRSLPPVMYAVYSDYAGDWRGEYTYLLGCGVSRVAAVPEGMETRRIPARTYAVFTAKGQMPDSILAVWGQVWLSGLPRTYTFDFEVNDQRFMRPTGREADVCVAVDPKRMEKAAG